MNELSVIIPSKNAANLKPCVEAVLPNEPNVRIFAVDDGIDWQEMTIPIIPTGEQRGWKTFRPGLTPIEGVKPFIFSRNVNLGIRAAGTDDVVILNDDALLETPGGFTLLQREAEAHPEIGIIGCTTNVTGAPCQFRHDVGLRIVNSFAFVAVLVPRRTIDAVGLLDERFTAYGWEDNDYIHRVKLAGLRVAVHDGCYVDHGILQSTFRTGNGAGDIEPGRKIFEEKWGASCTA